MLLTFLNNRITNVDATVAQKLNQGVSGKRAVYRFPVAFFGSFFSTKKRTIEKN